MRKARVISGRRSLVSLFFSIALLKGCDAREEITRRREDCEDEDDEQPDSHLSLISSRPFAGWRHRRAEAFRRRRISHFYNSSLTSDKEFPSPL